MKTLVNSVAARLGCSAIEARAAVDAVLKGLLQSKRNVLRGFGTFYRTATGLKFRASRKLSGPK